MRTRKRFISYLLQNQNKNIEMLGFEHTLGIPVLPLVYITTAVSDGRGKLASTGLSSPKLPTSSNDLTVQLVHFSAKDTSVETPSSLM